jgi:hypothetical protein
MWRVGIHGWRTPSSLLYLYMLSRAVDVNDTIISIGSLDQGREKTRGFIFFFKLRSKEWPRSERVICKSSFIVLHTPSVSLDISYSIQAVGLGR